jgi:RNA polymerase sigma-70 factor (ECF subfamily)
LDASAIASAFLTSPATMGQRLVRAKNRIRQSGAAFDIPARDELPHRLDAVLDAVYGAYAEGWTDPGGADLARRDLADEALFLGGLLAELLPQEPEALGLLALMLYAEARRTSRRDESGEYVPFSDQNPVTWNGGMIAEAERVLARASTLGRMGRYQLEAAVQSAHVHRRRTGEQNWPDIVELYDALWGLTGSPVVAINRALALAETEGTAAALEALHHSTADLRLAEYQPYWAVRAELLARSGATDEARRAYEVAVGLEHDAAVRRFLQRRLSALPA